jgi:hypothetical protein
MAVDADLDKLDDDEDAKAPPRFVCHHCGGFSWPNGRQNQIATVMPLRVLTLRPVVAGTTLHDAGQRTSGSGW